MAVHTVSPRAAATSDEQAPCRDAYVSSGPSPTALDLHLIGVGKVGRALLREVAASDLRLRCASDRSGSVFAKAGLDPLQIVRHKSEGQPLAGLPGAQAVHCATAVSLSGADAVVDCTATDPRDQEVTAERCRAVLRGGAHLVLAEKSFLATAPLGFLCRDEFERTHFNAVLGGTGQNLAGELPWLRQSVEQIVAVPNASTTALIEAVEAGHSKAQALQVAQQAGCLEADPSLDLDGTDAALKLLIVGKLLFGGTLTLAEIERQPFDSLDPELLRWRAQRGQTTRLVVRAREGGPWRVGYEAVERGSSLAVSSRRVVYGYQLSNGFLRLHGGAGVGPAGTARALLADLLAISRRPR